MSVTNTKIELWDSPWLISPAAHQQMCDMIDIALANMVSGQEPQANIEALSNADTQLQVVDGVAIIPISGPLMKSVHPILRMFGINGIDDIEADLVKALQDDSVQGIMLDVDSPGGSVTGIPELAKKIAAAATVKPVVAFTDTMMASAAYWLSAGASAIVASESANVGSIGVYMAFLDTSRAYEMAGVKTELIKAGKFKAAGIDGMSLTDEQRERMQAGVDQIANWFNGFVAQHRTAMPESAREGQTFFGIDAVAIDMVDRVGNADDAMAELRAMIQTRN